MATNIIRAKNFKLSKISYSDPKPLTSGGKSVYVNYDGGKGIVQTPVCFLPYGIQLPYKVTEKDDASKKNYAVEVSFSGKDSVPELQQLFDALKSLEEKIIDDAVANSVKWLGKKYTDKELVREKFSPIIKWSKDKDTQEIKTEYPPTFKVKLPWSAANDEFTFPCCDMNKTEINLTEIKNSMKGGRVRLLVQIAGLWFIAGKFGVTLKAFQGQFEPVVTAKGAYAFEDSDDDEDSGAKATKAKKHVEKIEFDEDLDDDAAEVAAAEAKTAKPTPKKEEPVEEEAAEEEEAADEEEAAEEEEAADEEEAAEEEEVPVTPPKKVAPAKKAVPAKAAPVVEEIEEAPAPLKKPVAKKAVAKKA